MTTDDLTTARLDVPAAVVEAQIARDVPASEVRPVMEEMHDRLMARPLDGEHLVQVHEFLDIDADIKDRTYPPIKNARKAIPGLYPSTSSPENYQASVDAGFVTPAYGDCEPTFTTKPRRPVADVETGGAL